MLHLIAFIWLFIVTLLMVALLINAYNKIRYPNRKKIQERLKNLSTGAYEPDNPDILRKKILSEIPFLDKILAQIPIIQSIETLIKQANSNYSVGFYLLSSLFAGLTGFLAIFFFTRNPWFGLFVAVFVALCPFIKLRIKKSRRIKRFQKQLPDALDLIARALKAGHAFTSGLKLAADELKDPLGSEFTETIDEINFGVSVSDALKNLTKRIDCPDLKFFAVSVILQRETGGNLAEIMESLASLIRKRFKFEGKVKVLSAEGRFSAAVLLALPIVIGVLVRLLNPEYIEILFQEPAGRISMAVALVSMTFGYVVIRRMIKINV
jgi:tight adherence protein B